MVTQLHGYKYSIDGVEVSHEEYQLKKEIFIYTAIFGDKVCSFTDKYNYKKSPYILDEMGVFPWSANHTTHDMFWNSKNNSSQLYLEFPGLEPAIELGCPFDEEAFNPDIKTNFGITMQEKMEKFYMLNLSPIHIKENLT